MRTTSKDAAAASETALCFVHRGPVRPVCMWGAVMKFILGVFVGAALMLGSAYLHDTGRLRAGPKQPFVNWDTVIGMLGR